MSTPRRKWSPGTVRAKQSRQRPSAYDFERAMRALHEIHELRKQATGEVACATETAPRRKA